MKKYGTVQNDRFFKAFLFLYLLVLLYHISNFDWESQLTIVGFILGIMLAVFAHLRRGYGTFILLTIHMAIEWSEYAKHGISYSGKEILFYGIHTILDFTFLWHEVKAHQTKYRYIITGSVTISLIVLFVCINHAVSKPLGFSTVSGYNNMQESNIIEAIVIGGILGCTLSHLFARNSEYIQKSNSSEY